MFSVGKNENEMNRALSHLCAHNYRLNWARRTSWGWWDDWDDTVLQTQDSKFEPWRSEAKHATSLSRRLPTILTFTRGWGRNIFCFFQTAETGNRTPNSGVKSSGANHYPRAPALSVGISMKTVSRDVVPVSNFKLNMDTEETTLQAISTRRCPHHSKWDQFLGFYDLNKITIHWCKHDIVNCPCAHLK